MYIDDSDSDSDAYRQRKMSGYKNSRPYGSDGELKTGPTKFNFNAKAAGVEFSGHATEKQVKDLNSVNLESPKAMPALVAQVNYLIRRKPFAFPHKSLIHK